MKYIQVYDNNSIAVFDHDSIPEFVGVDPRFIFYPEGRDDIVTGWFYENGEFSAPPAPVQQYKTDGITQQEWIKLFEKEERTLYTKAEAYINDMSNNFSFLSGGAIIDDNAIDVGRADATYRDLLRDVIFMFNRSTNPPGISVASPDVASAMALQVLLGLLTQARADVIILGVPL